MGRSQRRRLEELERQLDERSTFTPDFDLLIDDPPAFMASMRNTSIEKERQRRERRAQMSVEEILKETGGDTNDCMKQLEEMLKAEGYQAKSPEAQPKSGFVEVVPTTSPITATTIGEQ